MSFKVQPQPDACRAWMPTERLAPPPTPGLPSPGPIKPPPGPHSPPLVCHMPKGHEGQHSNERRPTTLSRRWEGDARPAPAADDGQGGPPYALDLSPEENARARAVANRTHPPSPDPGEVERVARAIGDWLYENPAKYWRTSLHEQARRLIAAFPALAAARPATDAEQKVARVEALAEEIEDEAMQAADRCGIPLADFLKGWRADAPARIRVALSGAHTEPKGQG